MERSDNSSFLVEVSKKRKKRCNKGKRNFICGCGKAYLSYPALYLHVKLKHSGIFPKGCIKDGKC